MFFIVNTVNFVFYSFYYNFNNIIHCISVLASTDIIENFIVINNKEQYTYYINSLS